MKKFLDWIKGFFTKATGDLVVDAAITQLGQIGEEALENFYAQKPKSCIAFVQSFYSLLPILQDATVKTKTKLDDKAVVEAKKDIEEFAIKHSIDLVDLDDLGTD